MSDVSQTKDFSRKRKKIEFRVDEDTFHAAPAIPAEVLTDFVIKFSDVGSLPVIQRVEALTEALEMVLQTESFSRFKSRMRDRENPIELDQLNDIIVWLMEQYGQRPTQPSSPSLDGSPNPESGTNSMENSQALVSTFNP